MNSRLDPIVPIRNALRVGFAAYGAWAYFRGMANAHPGLGLHGSDLAVSLLVTGGVTLLLAGLYLVRRDSRLAAVPMVVAIVSSFVLYLMTPSSPAITVACVGLFLAATRLPDVPATVLSGSTVCTGFIVGAAAHGGNADLTTIVAFVATLFGAMASRQAKTVRNVEGRNAVLAERSRIAREIHDILAHSLSAQIVHLEGARLLLINGKSEDALDRIERAQGMARSGLEETRRALATLRGEVPPVAEVLDSLAEEFHAATGEVCAIEVSGGPRDLSPEAGLAVIRTAQEALTNVRKHAPGATARVALRYLDDWTELEVTDSPPPSEPPPSEPPPSEPPASEAPASEAPASEAPAAPTAPTAPTDAGARAPTGGAGVAASLAGTGGGYGLVGMRERAALIDGTLEAGPTDDGFRVLLRVPA